MQQNVNVGIVGNGFVGKACQILGEARTVNCLVYDIDSAKCMPQGLTMNEMVQRSQLIFICVPTPSLPSGDCDVNIVEHVVETLRKVVKSNWPAVIVRSTVPPGTCERLGVMHMPEYLTEKKWNSDFRQNPVWHVGIPQNTFFDHKEACKNLQELYTTCKQDGVIVSDKLHLAHSSETELTKYMRNCLLATRVSVCNEIEGLCRCLSIDYDAVRNMAIQDPRVGSSHTLVPGPDGVRGYGGTCLPKDLKALVRCMQHAGVRSFVLRGCDERNDLIDRPQQDWKKPGRSVTE